MPRRRVPEKREILPDPKYGNQTLAKFMNHVMVSGKKSVAEKIVYGAMDRIVDRNGGDPIEVFDAALEDMWKGYRQIPPARRDLRFLVVTFFHTKLGKVIYSQLFGLPFGFLSAVLQFNRTPMFEK